MAPEISLLSDITWVLFIKVQNGDFSCFSGRMRKQLVGEKRSRWPPLDRIGRRRRRRRRRRRYKPRRQEK
jgi:hypothetical protein